MKNTVIYIISTTIYGSPVWIFFGLKMYLRYYVYIYIEVKLKSNLVKI